MIVPLLITTGCILPGCGSFSSPTSNAPAVSPALTTPAANLVLPSGYEAEIIAAGLQGPTQMIVGPDGWLWLAQLAGAENAGSGQIMAISLDTAKRRLLLDSLFKPTGIAVLASGLWIASGRNLLRAPISDKNEPGAVETILNDLPFNGRSNGTLTVTPTGHLLFETSGRRSGNQADKGSATLWELDPTNPTQPSPIATGLKGAYAHTFDEAGRLWATEISDDPVNGAAAPDELNWIVEEADFGWPQCFGQQQPALNYGGSAAVCQTSRAPVALFPPGSTPTSVIVSPWEKDTLLVALWRPPEQGVMRVQIKISSENAVGRVEPFITGLQNPISLLLWPDGNLLVSDFDAGVIYRIRPSGVTK